MKHALVAGCLIVVLAPLSLAAQQRRSAAHVTLVFFVVDPAGSPVTGAKVTISGPAQRSGTTERGRLAFEDLPAGTYHMHFEREGFEAVDRDLDAHGAAPIDVKITMTAMPKPEPPPAPVPSPPPAPDPNAKATFVDTLAFLDKNYVGRAAGKQSPIACSNGGSATIIQINDPMAEHTHADADEYLYVISGDGAAHVNGKDQPVKPGAVLLIPRGLPHSMDRTGKNPLIMLSMKAGDHCSGGQQ